MKAITITQELKDRNKIFQNRAVGSIYQGSLPNSFWGAERIVGGYAGRADLHEADGWFNVVFPLHDTETEKLGAIYFNVDKFTFPVVAMTPEELAERLERNLNSDSAQQDIDTRRVDGQLGYDRSVSIIERKFRAGEITANQAKGALQFFDPLIEGLNRGQWIIVQIKMNAATVPAGYQELFTTIKEKVDTYIQNNY